MGAFQNYLENETDARSAISIVMMIKCLARLYHEGNPKWALVPTDKDERSTLGGAIKMGGSAGQWMDDTWTNGTIQAMYGNDNNALIKNRLAKARTFIRNHPSDRVDFRLSTGFMGAISAMNDAGQRAYWSVLCVSLALVFAVAFLVFRSFLPGVAIIVSLITAQSITWIFMALTNIGISIHIIPTGPFSMGVGGAMAILVMACSREKALPYPDSAKPRQGATFPVGPLAALGLIPVGMMLPWAFIDLKFMARAGALLSVSVFAQTALALVLPTFLTNSLKETFRITQKTNRGKR
jgi:predicted RND superfamily exporter protein